MEHGNTAGLQQISQMGSNNYLHDGKGVQDDFTPYFCSSEGSLEWQLLRVSRDRALNQYITFV